MKLIKYKLQQNQAKKRMNKFIASAIIAVGSQAIVIRDVNPYYMEASEHSEAHPGSVETMLAQQDSTQESCYRAGVGRGAGTFPDSCADGLEKELSLCYPSCNSGYDAFASSCSQRCPSGFTDLGLSCAKPSISRPTGRYWWGGTYYKSCPSGYDDYGFICLEDCPSGFDDWGTSCEKDVYFRGHASALSCSASKVD